MYKASIYNYSIRQEDTHYIYNTLSRAFIALQDDLWLKVCSGSFENVSDSDRNTLLKTGIVVPENVDEKWVMKEILSRASQQNEGLSVFLSMTSSCNLACPYCYQDYRKETNTKTYMTKESVDAICRFFNESQCKNISVVYFGGEPTLDSDTLIYAINSINSIKEKSISNSLITNGYILSSELIDTIKKYNNFLVQVTLDGNRDLHDSLRTTPSKQPTYDKIMKNIERLTMEIPKSVVVRINVTSKNFLPYKEAIDHLHNTFGNSIEIGLEAVFNGQKKTNETGLGGTHDILELYDYIHEKGYNTLPKIEYSPCIARMRNAMAIDENLNVYSCPARLYEKTAGHITSEGELLITDNCWYEDLFFSKPCTATCMYGGLCGGGCSLYHNECRKHIIDQLIHYVVSKKAEKYAKERKK